MSARDEGHDREPDGVGLSFDNSFDSCLQPFNLIDRVGAGYLSALDSLEVSHELTCILHAKSTRRTEKFAATYADLTQCDLLLRL
jgi:hypothetical protein